MKRFIVAAALVVLAAACGPKAEEEVVVAPTGLMEQAQAMSGEDAAVFAYTTFMTKVPTLERPCVAVRETLSRGVIPEDVAADSIYAPYKGSLVFAIQCGEMRTEVRADPHDHYMLVLSPGATDAIVAPCLDTEGVDGCRGMARAVPAPAGAPAAPDAAKTN